MMDEQGGRGGGGLMGLGGFGGGPGPGGIGGIGSAGAMGQISPYLNIDPSYLQTDAPQFILNEVGESRDAYIL